MLPAPWASRPTFKGSGAWFPCQAQQSIAYTDLFPVVVAPFTWGPQWFRKHIMFYSDNEAVVHMLTSKGRRLS